MGHSAKDTDIKHRTSTVFSGRIAGAFAAVLISLGLMAVTSASAASFETVGHFGGVLKAPSVVNQFPEEVQLGSVSALAINTAGAGGVAPGTIYAIGGEGPSSIEEVAKFSPTGGFEEAWLLNGKRCGPATEEPVNSGLFTHCSASTVGTPKPVGIDIDQATGNVYVEVEANVVKSQKVPSLRVYNPNGTKLITEFGEADMQGTIAKSPEKLHGRRSKGGIAVNDSGDVYVFDEDESFHYRIMQFKPQTPGDYEHYVYAGQGSDIAVGGGGTTGVPSVEEPALDQAGNLYGRSGDNEIVEYNPAQPSTPVCTFSLPAGGINTSTANPVTGEVFYFSYKDRQIHRLKCNGEGKFVQVSAFGVAPVRGPIEAMTVDGERKYDPQRPAGILYGATPQASPNVGGGGEPGAGPLGYILALPEEKFPSVESESVSNVTTTTASLSAQINPKGSLARYVFQYLDDAAYEANEPDERQSLSVSAAGGVFGLGLEGRHLGGEASGTLTAGSKTVSALATARGTATLKGAIGTATLEGAEGKGTFVAGSNVISAVSFGKGKFEVGQGIAGAGIPTGIQGNNAVDTTITAVAPEEGLPTFEITISSPAAKTSVGAKITSAATSLTEVSTSKGSFEVGQTIEGGSIPVGTTITAVKGSELALSRPPTAPAVGLSVNAAFPTLTEVSPSIGSFEVGQTIEGEGISNAEVRAVNGDELTLFNGGVTIPVRKPGTSVVISSPGPAPLAIGEQVEGPGIPPGTTITAIKAGEATLSNAATASGTGVILRAGLPAAASPPKVRAALEGLPTIGGGNVEVSGGPGDETGSTPYEIIFTGKFENVDVPQLSADASGLSGGTATAAVKTEHNGGGGFAGALEVPPGGAVLGEGQSALSAAIALSGLEPGTGYHFRAVATSHCSALDEAKVCEGAGASKAFRTAPSEAPVLPDNRAWELVSPAQKHGGQVIPSAPNISSCGGECKPGVIGERFPQQSSPDGESVVYMGYPFSFGEGAVNFNEYVSRRTPLGWQTTTLSPELVRPGGGRGYLAFDTALGRGLLYQHEVTLTPDAPGGYPNIYSQPTSAPSALSNLLSVAPPNRPEGGGRFSLIYAGASADLSHVFFEANDALTEETPFAPEAVDGGEKKNNLYEWSEEGLRLVNVAPGNGATNPGAAFGSGFKLADGSEPQANLSHAISADGSRVFWSSESGQVYMRENDETTREISDHAGKFLTASSDGSKLLLSDGHLFELDNGEAMIDLTAGKGGFQGIAGQSEDLSHIYFVDTQVLDETPNGHGVFAQEGEDNLYAWHEGSIRFVATLLPNEGSGRIWSASPGQRTAEASPNGRWLAFLSRGRPTGYDNVGACEYDPTQKKFALPGSCPEAYLYDSTTEQLRCASCNPSGEAPLGPTNLRLISGAQGFLPQPRYLTDEGRLYFDTSDSLSAFDTNQNVEDVYQYEPQGVGTCKREGGCVSLISAGHEAVDSNFVTMDESGKNVFFTSRDQLTLKDKDDLIDLYDAREGGGIPAESETARSECQGEACQPLYAAPNDPTPASSSFEGAGNVSEPKAAKKHAKKHKKKHAKKKHAHKRAAKHNRGGAK